ncbi:MAG: anti-sigma factor family protein, partial [Terriglobia bacterium]
AYMITCREFVEFLADYLAGALPRASLAEFEFHLTDCPDCVLYLKSYEATVWLGKEAFADLEAPVPAEVPEELIEGILAARSKVDRGPPYSV